MKQLEAVTLDFWGTLVIARHSLRHMRLDCLAARLPHVPRAEIEAAYAVAWQAYEGVRHQGIGLATPTMLSYVLERLGVALSPPHYLAVCTAWDEAIVHTPPPLLPGAAGMLAELRRRRLLVGLISDTGISTGASIRRVLADYGLLSAFDWLTFSDEIGVTKDTPFPFRHTLAALDVAPQRAVHVGDMPETDIRGAHAAGMMAALVLESSDRRDGIPPSGGQSPEIGHADLILERLADLPDALDHWIASDQSPNRPPDRG